MHLSLASPGVDPRGTYGIPRGLVGDGSILGKKLCPRGWNIVRLLQGMLNSRGMHPRDLLCLGQRCTLQLAWQYEAVAAFPLQTRFALQTRLMWKIINKIQYYFRAHSIDSILE